MVDVRKFTNIAPATSLAGPLTGATTTFDVGTLTGYPAVPFGARIAKGTATEEVVLVTAKSGVTVTVTRGYDGTSAQAHSLGEAFEHVAVAADYNDSNTHILQTTGVHGATGSLLDTGTTQTAANKTFTASRGEATVTEPAWRITSTPANSHLLLGLLDAAVVVTITRDGLANFAKLAVATPTAAVGAGSNSEFRSVDTNSAIRTITPSTTVGIDVTSSADARTLKLTPAKIEVNPATGSAKTTIDPGVIDTVAPTGTGLGLSVKTGLDTATDGLTVKNSSNLTVFAVKNDGDVVVTKNLTAQDCTFDDVTADTLDVNTITLGAGNVNVETRLNAIDADVTVLETNNARGVATATADVNGVVEFAHGLGVLPTWWGGTPANQATELLNSVVKIVSWTADSTVIRFKAYRSDTGTALASNPIKIYWEAYK